MIPSGITWRDVRKVSNTGREIVQWQLVDPWIRKCAEPGDLAALGAYLRISMKAMRQRRSLLGMPPTRPGRPRNPVPTQPQMEALIAMSKTGSPTKAAALVGGSPAGVAMAAKRAQAKTFDAHLASRCKPCNGTGVVLCSRCNGNKLHTHVCEKCGGDGHV